MTPARLPRTPLGTPRRALAAAAIGTILLLAVGCGTPDADAGAPGDPHLMHVNDAVNHEHHPVPLDADAPLPGASLYHLDAGWTDHRGEPLVLNDLRGHPVVIVMMYASCETACPILIRDALRLDAALPETDREATRFLMVTFDTENDAPERLAAYVDENGLEDPRWRFAVGDAAGTRALAAMLGVRYRPTGNGMFSHSNLITVLGPDGVPRDRVEGLGMPSERLAEAIAGVR